jgi:cytoplasmic iron level regulating protein YaaA (DUF328/UPF0246 family)
MKFILSPAKTLKIQPTTYNPTIPQTHSLTVKLLKKLKQLKLNQYESIFSTSQKLSQQVHTSIQSNTIHPAIFYYHGEAFKSLNISEMNDENIQTIQKHVYIYSALYGLIRPLDGIQFYRLDFLTPLEKIGINNTHTIIKKEITNKLLHEEDEVIVLLCSQECKDMIDLSKLRKHKKTIDIVFISIQNGKEKIVSVHAKQARGSFLKQCIISSVTDLEGIYSITSFNGWLLDIESSTPTQRVYKKSF